MLCEICHKNEANVHMTQFVNGEFKKLHICESCARERGAMKVGIEVPVGIGEDGPELPFSLDDFFQNFVKNVMMNPGGDMPFDSDGFEVQEIKPSRVCPTCHTTIEDYLKNGAGCEDCYPAFKHYVVDMLEGYMRTNLIPEGNKQKRELINKLEEVMRLRDDLNISVAVEDYENAGVLRDKIQAITDKI